VYLLEYQYEKNGKFYAFIEQVAGNHHVEFRNAGVVHTSEISLIEAWEATVSASGRFCLLPDQ